MQESWYISLWCGSIRIGVSENAKPYIPCNLSPTKRVLQSSVLPALRFSLSSSFDKYFTGFTLFVQSAFQPDSSFISGSKQFSACPKLQLVSTRPTKVVTKVLCSKIRRMFQMIFCSLKVFILAKKRETNARRWERKLKTQKYRKIFCCHQA